MVEIILIGFGGVTLLLYAAKSFRLYVHSFTATYFVEGALCLSLTYGFGKINTVEHGGKRTFVIAGGELPRLQSGFQTVNKKHLSSKISLRGAQNHLGRPGAGKSHIASNYLSALHKLS